MSDTEKICLNCGEAVSGKFCSNCGQPANVPEKMNNKTFGKSVILCFSRLSSAFFRTLISLIYKPWDVIRDFIHGKQLRYSHPVTMLIQLGLVSTFIFTFLEGAFGIMLVNNSEVEGNWFIKLIKTSPVIKVLWVSVPVIFAGYLVYWNFGSRRFTFSEYLIAALYIIISIKIISYIFYPINYYWFDGDPLSDFNFYIVSVSMLILGGITVLKAFKIKSKWRAALQFGLFGALAFVFLLAYTMFFQFIDDVILGKDTENWISNFFSE